MWTYPSNAAHDHEPLGIGGIVHLLHRDARAHLEGRAGVPGAAGVVGAQVADFVQVVRPHGQGAAAGGLGVEVVARVLDDEAQVLVAGKVDGELDLGHWMGKEAGSAWAPKCWVLHDAQPGQYGIAHRW